MQKTPEEWCKNLWRIKTILEKWRNPKDNFRKTTVIVENPKWKMWIFISDYDDNSSEWVQLIWIFHCIELNFSFAVALINSIDKSWWILVHRKQCSSKPQSHVNYILTSLNVHVFWLLFIGYRTLCAIAIWFI